MPKAQVSIAPASGTSAAFVVSIEDSSGCTGELVGGKALSLGRLAATGVNVPAGFVVTTDAFRLGLSQAGVELPRGSAALLRFTPVAADGAAKGRPVREGDAEAQPGLRQRLLELPLPSPIACEVRDAYRELGCPAVAVRSSGVAEDTESASFAGQYETVLNVRGESAVLAAVKRCWASLYQPGVLAYLADRVDAGIDLSMAVVVQRLVSAEVAGVLFTINPLTGRESETLIEAAFGLGESVVAGRVEVDRYIVDSDTLEVRSRQIARQSHRIEAVEDGGTRESVLAPEVGEGATLDDAQLGQLTRLGARVQQEFGRPMDLEWAYDAQGSLHLLQARPITRIDFSPDLGEWTTADFRDGGVSSTVCSPFMYSLYQIAFQSSMSAYVKRIKLSSAVEQPRWIAMFFGRPYWNVGAIKQLLQRIPGYCERNLDRDLGIEPSYEGDGVKTPPTVAGVVRALPVLFALRRCYRKALAQNEAFVARAAERRAPFDLNETALRRLHDGTFATSYRRLIEDLYLETETHYFTTIYNTSNAKLDFKVQFARAERAAGELELLALFGGLRDLAHLRPLKDLDQRLADLARRRASVDDELVRSFGHAWRHHSRRELDIRVPRWHEDHEYVRQMLQQALASYDPDRTVAAREEQQFAAFEREAQRAEHALRWRPLARRRFAKQLALVRRYAWWREEMRDHSSYLYYLIRLWSLEAAKRLVARGALQAEEEIWCLPYGDVCQLLAGELSVAAAAERVRAGRRLMRSFRSFDNPNEIGSRHGLAAQPVASSPGSGHLSGTGCSGGRVTGRARVVPDLLQAEALQAGEILVTRFTDPGWTPLFSRVAAVVTETGGVLAHAAVIAREYGIPAVLAVEGATKRIGDGDQIVVDGHRGVVEIVARAAAESAAKGEPAASAEAQTLRPVDGEER